MNHAARFLIDAETICREIPRERIELLVDGLAQLRERGGRLSCSASAAAPETAATR
jgi:hypothetical protein